MNIKLEFTLLAILLELYIFEINNISNKSLKSITLPYRYIEKDILNRALFYIIRIVILYYLNIMNILNLRIRLIYN